MGNGGLDGPGVKYIAAPAGCRDGGFKSRPRWMTTKTKEKGQNKL